VSMKLFCAHLLTLIILVKYSLALHACMQVASRGSHIVHAYAFYMPIYVRISVGDHIHRPRLASYIYARSFSSVMYTFFFLHDSLIFSTIFELTRVAMNIVDTCICHTGVDLKSTSTKKWSHFRVHILYRT
jgi:hypothetical protein